VAYSGFLWVLNIQTLNCTLSSIAEMTHILGTLFLLLENNITAILTPLHVEWIYVFLMKF